MNAETRAALVEELDEAMRRYTGTLLSCTAEAEACLPIIDRLLAERHGETTVPLDAERVERVKSAISGVLRDAWSGDDEKRIYPCDMDNLARAALAAAGNQDDFDLDEMLDELTENGCDDTRIELIRNQYGKWKATIIYARGGDEHGNVDWAVYYGTGSTRKDAVTNAITTTLNMRKGEIE